MSPLFAQSLDSSSVGQDAFMLGAIAGITIAVIVCSAIPLMTGISQGKVMLGIIGALITIPAAGLLGCIGGLPVAAVISGIITLIPKFHSKELLSQAEIEAEMRRARRM